MKPVLMHQVLEFAKTIRFSHTLFALPFALGAALVAEPPYPDAAALGLLVVCLVTARTAAMGFNRVADAALDGRNPRTADRAIPAGRLGRRAALGLVLASGAAFWAAAWGFFALRGNPWPAILAPAFLAVLLGYSYTKRFTVLTHWILGLCLGLASPGVWIALRGSLALAPILIGTGVMFWTAGFDILYAIQDTEVDRREGLKSIPARFGREAALRVAAASQVVTVLALASALWVQAGPAHRPQPVRVGQAGLGSLGALLAMAAILAVQHFRAPRATDRQLAARFFPLNALVSILWFLGVVLDIVISRSGQGIS